MGIASSCSSSPDNIRNVKSNYLKCIASRCLSPPCVLFFLSNFDGQRARVSQYDSLMLMHDLSNKGNLVSWLFFPSNRGRAAKKPWKRGWYKARKDPNFLKIIYLIILSKMKIPSLGINDKKSALVRNPNNFYIVRGNQLAIS